MISKHSPERGPGEGLEAPPRGATSSPDDLQEQPGQPAGESLAAPGWARALLPPLAATGTLYLWGTSPALGWLSVMGLMCFARAREPLARRALAIATVVTAALVYSSRDTSGSWSDDLANVYYPLYVGIREGSLPVALPTAGEVFRLSSVELALPVLLRVLGAFPFVLSAGGLVFTLTLVGGLLYVWWLETYLLPDLPEPKRMAASALSLSLFSFGLCSQTARQMLGVPLLLAAIWETRRAQAWALTAGAALLHLSAVPVFLVWRLVATRPRIAFLVVGLVATALLQLGASLPESLVGVDFGSFDKLEFYARLSDELGGFDRSFLPVVLALCAAAWLARAYRKGDISRLVFAFSALFAALLPLPLASFRLTLFALAGLLGPMAALAVAHRTSDRSFSALAFALGTLMVVRRILASDAGSGMGLWHAFQPVEVVPFRYVGLLFR